LKKLSEIVEFTDFFFKKELDYDTKLLSWKGQPLKEVGSVIKQIKKRLSKTPENQWTEEGLQSLLLEEANKAGDRGKVLWPFRVAITGKEQSAGPFEVAATLGKKKVLARLEAVLKIL